MKSDIAMKNCDYFDKSTKNGKDTVILSFKMKKLNRN